MSSSFISATCCNSSSFNPICSNRQQLSSFSKKSQRGEKERERERERGRDRGTEKQSDRTSLWLLLLLFNQRFPLTLLDQIDQIATPIERKELLSGWSFSLVMEMGDIPAHLFSQGVPSTSFNQSPKTLSLSRPPPFPEKWSHSKSNRFYESESSKKLETTRYAYF